MHAVYVIYAMEQRNAVEKMSLSATPRRAATHRDPTRRRVCMALDQQQQIVCTINAIPQHASRAAIIRMTRPSPSLDRIIGKECDKTMRKNARRERIACINNCVARLVDASWHTNKFGIIQDREYRISKEETFVRLHWLH